MAEEMTEEEFRRRAEEMGYDDEIISDIIFRHNNDEFALPYEEELIGTIESYPSNNAE